MGARCQSIKGSWTRQKGCHSDLLLNSRALVLFVFCENQIFTNKMGQAAFLLWKQSQQKRDGCLAQPLQGQHLPQFSKAAFFFFFFWWGGKKNLWPPHPQNHLLCNVCYFFKIAFSPPGFLASPFSKDEK